MLGFTQIGAAALASATVGTISQNTLTGLGAYVFFATFCGALIYFANFNRGQTYDEKTSA